MLLSTVSYKKEENPVSLKTKRIEFIDALKGIVIFLVVYTHCYECVKGVRFGDPEIMADNFYAFGLAFHMPLFMFLSGLFSKSLIANDLSYFLKSIGVIGDKSILLLSPIFLFCKIKNK